MHKEQENIYSHIVVYFRKSLLQWPKEMISGESKATSLMCAWSLPSSSPRFIGNLLNHHEDLSLVSTDVFFPSDVCLFGCCWNPWKLSTSACWWWYIQRVKYISFFNDQCYNFIQRCLVYKQWKTVNHCSQRFS